MAGRSLLFAALALVATTPSAAAEPACIQAYPWSEVCSAAGHLLPELIPPGEGCLPSPLASCQLPLGDPVCVQALPWSAVCDAAGLARDLLG